MTVLFSALIVMAIYSSLFAVMVRYVSTAVTPQQTIKRAKGVAVMAVLSVCAGLAVFLWFINNNKAQLDSAYHTLAAKSEAHRYAVTEFRNCVERPFKHVATPTKNTLDGCRIYTYKQIANSPYKDDWPVIKQDLKAFIAYYLK